MAKQFLITVDADWEPEDGDAFDILLGILEDADVSATIVEVNGPDLLDIRNQARLAVHETLHQLKATPLGVEFVTLEKMVGISDPGAQIEN